MLPRASSGTRSGRKEGRLSIVFLRFVFFHYISIFLEVYIHLRTDCVERSYPSVSVHDFMMCDFVPFKSISSSFLCMRLIGMSFVVHSGG